jgi:hypothetical protein
LVSFLLSLLSSPSSLLFSTPIINYFTVAILVQAWICLICIS